MTPLEQILAVIEEAERVRGEATAPPWRKGWLESYNATTGEPEAFVYRLPPEDAGENAHNRLMIRGAEGKMDCDADAALIVHARNVNPWPALRRAVEQMEREVQLIRRDCNDHENPPQGVPHEVVCFSERKAIRMELALAEIAAMLQEPKEDLDGS